MKGCLQSLYIHIPYCLSKCAYCDFFSRACGNRSIPDSYIAALCNEIKYRLTGQVELSTIYIGGGTPSLLSQKQLSDIFASIKKSAVITSGTEITVEVNPDDVSKEFLLSLENCGVNRISCGIQSMNDKCLSYTNRRANSKINQNALMLFQKYWKGDLSLDLISALPGDDEEGLEKSLSSVCAVKPSHISLYSLAIEENTPLGKSLSSGELEYDFDRADKLWIFGRDYLEKKGYSQYEVSNFCLPGKGCRHNMAYWGHEDYAGCGSGATGTLYKKNGEGQRWTNTTDIEKYIEFWTSDEKGLDGLAAENIPQTLESISLETSKFEFFMMGMRKLEGISEAEYEKLFGEKLPANFLELFEKWEKKGLCQRQGGRYALNKEGILFLNSFLEELL